MKNIIAISLCIFLSTSLFAQHLKYLYKKDISCNDVLSLENRNSSKDGAIVVSTSIRDLNFKVPESYYKIDKIDSTSINGYILIIKYNPVYTKNFALTVFGNKYSEYYLNTGVNGCYKLRASYRKPFDWIEDFKIIVGLSNGIVAGEIFGLYGELKFGNKTGFALVGGYSPGFNSTYDERWSAGIKGYYKYWFLSGHYGTTINVKNRNISFIMDDDGFFILEGSKTIGRKGVTTLVGYDRTLGWFNFNAGIGTTITTTISPKFLFAWNVGLGVSLIDLVSLLD